MSKIRNLTEQEEKEALALAAELRVTQKDREEVTEMAKLGLGRVKIAKIKNMRHEVFRKIFHKELALGDIECQEKVLKTAFDMAVSGKNTTMTIFYLKTRCGIRDPHVSELHIKAKQPAALTDPMPVDAVSAAAFYQDLISQLTAPQNSVKH